MVATITEIPPVIFLPNFLVQRKVLRPLRTQTGGTIMVGWMGCAAPGPYPTLPSRDLSHPITILLTVFVPQQAYVLPLLAAGGPVEGHFVSKSMRSVPAMVTVLWHCHNFVLIAIPKLPKINIGELVKSNREQAVIQHLPCGHPAHVLFIIPRQQRAGEHTALLCLTTITTTFMHSSHL